MEIHLFEHGEERYRQMLVAADAIGCTVRLHTPITSTWDAQMVDAVYLSLTAAERRGPKPVLDRAQVLRATDEEVLAGHPKYVIAGPVSRAPLNLSPEGLVTLILGKVQQARNAMDVPTEIRRVAFAAGWLGLDPLSPEEAICVVCRAAESLEQLGRPAAPE